MRYTKLGIYAASLCDALAKARKQQSPERLAGLATERPIDGFLRTGLKINHMRMMVALEESGQVSTAAQLLNISQPAASRMISEIETLLQVPVCERRPRGIALNAYGRAVARRARAVLLELREAEREIDDLRTGQGGTVSFGTVTAPAIHLVTPAIKRLRRMLPQIDITIEVATSAELAGDLLASRHDFYIGRVPDDLNPRLFGVRQIGLERACLVVRRGHPLMDRERVSLTDLVAYDWVLQPNGSLLRRVLESLFVSAGIPLPDRILNTSSSLLTLVMLTQTDAIAPLSRDVAAFVNDPGGLAGAIDVLPIDFEIDLRAYGLVTARNRVLSPAAQILHDFIVEQTALGDAES